MTLIDELNSYKVRLELVDSSFKNLEQTLITLDDQKQQNDNRLKCVNLYRQYYKKAIDIVYERSIKELKDVINTALDYIFVGKDLEVDIELSDKRGKSMTFVVRHNNKKVNLKRGMGMGVKCVISCILQIYYLQCKGSKKLLLDEAYSNISKEYIANFFDFLTKMCKRLNFTIILITHDERFIDYANKVYEINDGYVSLVKESFDELNG